MPNLSFDPFRLRLFTVEIVVYRRLTPALFQRQLPQALEMESVFARSQDWTGLVGFRRLNVFLANNALHTVSTSKCTQRFFQTLRHGGCWALWVRSTQFKAFDAMGPGCWAQCGVDPELGENCSK